MCVWEGAGEGGGISSFNPSEIFSGQTDIRQTDRHFVANVYRINLYILGLVWEDFYCLYLEKLLSYQLQTFIFLVLEIYSFYWGKFYYLIQQE